VLGALFHKRALQAAHALSALADLAGQFDADGIDIYFLNDTRVGENMTVGPELVTAHYRFLIPFFNQNREAVEELFAQIRPRGVTPIGEKLEELLRAYLSRLEAAHDSGNIKAIKPVSYLVITDGAPSSYLEYLFYSTRLSRSSADDPESVIVQAARRLDARHFPITQVRNHICLIYRSCAHDILRNPFILTSTGWNTICANRQVCERCTVP
jgi:hypothetical protein